jgi:hypothetical protein
VTDIDTPLEIDQTINLVDFDRVKALIGWKSTSTINDDLLIEAINAVNELIHDYTQRQFVKDAAPETRRFLLQPDDVDERSLMIDDLAELDSVELKLRDGTLVETCDLNLVDAKTHSRRPNQPVVELEFIPGFATSARIARHQAVDVTATWGWPQIPTRATYWAMQTIAAWSTKDLSKFSASYRLDAQRIEIPRLLPDAAKAGLKMLRRDGLA